MLSQMHGEPVGASFDAWRPGDQPCYVSDIRKAKSKLGWEPLLTKDEGLQRLWDWIADNSEMFKTLEPIKAA